MLYWIHQCYLVEIRGYFMVDEFVEKVMSKCMLLRCCFAAGSVEPKKMAGNKLCKLYISSYANSTQAKKLRRSRFLGQLARYSSQVMFTDTPASREISHNTLTKSVAFQKIIRTQQLQATNLFLLGGSPPPNPPKNVTFS